MSNQCSIFGCTRTCKGEGILCRKCDTEINNSLRDQGVVEDEG